MLSATKTADSADRFIMSERYLLTSNHQLRGWLFNLYALVDTSTHRIDDLSVAEFNVLARCDGAHDVQPDDEHADIFRRYLESAVIERVDERGATGASATASLLAPEQEYRLYPCWRFRDINWAMTGRCNFNCRHCFAAKDAHPTVDEPTLAQCLDFVDQLADCGVDHVWLTGGEPLMRSDILDITARIAEKGILLEEFGTNASLLTAEFLDQLEKQGHDPQFNVSFDGVGHHDWMRGVPDTEERTLAGIELLKSHGFRVKVQSCICRENLDALRETTELLARMHVDELRVIRVVESKRWMETTPEQTLSLEDYYRSMLDYAQWYLASAMPMQLDIWGIVQIQPDSRWCRIVPVHHVTPKKDATQPICGDARQMPFVGCDGEISLCNQISGYMKSIGTSWGNAYRDPLAQLLSDSAFIDQLLCTWGKVRAHNPECSQCEFKQLCNCGCRAVALATTGDIMGKDISQCVFFKGGWYDAYRELAVQHGLQGMGVMRAKENI